MGLRTEASVSLTLAWNPREAWSTDDADTFRRFMEAVQALRRLPSVRLVGDTSALAAMAGIPSALPAPKFMTADAHRQHFVEATKRCPSIAEAAVEFGVSRRTIQRWRRLYGLARQYPRPRPHA